MLLFIACSSEKRTGLTDTNRRITGVHRILQWKVTSGLLHSRLNGTDMYVHPSEMLLFIAGSSEKLGLQGHCVLVWLTLRCMFTQARHCCSSHAPVKKRRIWWSKSDTWWRRRGPTAHSLTAQEIHLWDTLWLLFFPAWWRVFMQQLHFLNQLATDGGQLVTDPFSLNSLKMNPASTDTE